ncbi:MAG: carboxypeptidase regulatory-like domain-containing protein, partial [Thermoplasmata archaeon]|nr:carboxypeptidase regulatory-like domain-containing protein [Thermoplasmata archaeon]
MQRPHAPPSAGAADRPGTPTVGRRRAPGPFWAGLIGSFLLVGLLGIPVISASPNSHSPSSSLLSSPSPGVGAPAPPSIPLPRSILPGLHPSPRSPLNVTALLLAHDPKPAAAPGSGEIVGYPRAARPVFPDGNVSAEPGPLPPPVATGTVYGVVVNASDGEPLTGVNVSVFTVFGGGCLAPECAVMFTNSTGEFSIAAAPVGLDSVLASLPSFESNQTDLNVPANGTVDVGTIGLFPLGRIYGVLVGSDPAHEAAANVSVTVELRGGNGTGQLFSSCTDAAGEFALPAPLGAVEVSFLPPPPSASAPQCGFPSYAYDPNETFQYVTTGESIDLGDVQLLRGVPVQLDVTDRETGQTLYLPPGDMRACNADTGECWQGSAPAGVFAGNITYAAPGPTIAEVEESGYLTNSTSIGFIPAQYDTPVVRSIQLVAYGILQVTVEVDGQSHPTGLSGVDGSVLVCSLDGFSYDLLGSPLYSNLKNGTPYPVCLTQMIPYFGGPVDIAVFPMSISVLWGPPGGTPLFSNTSWYNITPHAVTYGVVNLTAGYWITGQAEVDGSNSPLASPYFIQACSTDEISVCGQDVLGAPGVPVGTSVTGCGALLTSFCVPAPPGPIELTVAQASEGTNVTWAEVPVNCCPYTNAALTLASLTWDHEHILNVSQPTSEVTGTVELFPSIFAASVAGASLNLCPVAASTGCLGGEAQLGAPFDLTVPGVGWYQLQVTASDYRTNATWVYADGSNDTGTIWLTPFAGFTGTVVDPSGHGIVSAGVTFCSPSDPQFCFGGNPSITGSSGEFTDSVPVGPFPNSAILITAGAPGYLDASMWVNATPGATVNLTPLILQPASGAGRPASPEVPHPAVAAAAVNWVTAEVLDNRSGEPIGELTPTACLFGGGGTAGGCSQLVGTDTDGGAFNASLALGQYDLYLNLSGFTSIVEFLNLSGPPVDLGVLRMLPDPRLAGQLDFGPWESLTTSIGIGPGEATAYVCTARFQSCSQGGFVSAGGEFNVSAPIGTGDVVTISAALPGLAIGGSPTVYSSYVGFQNVTETWEPFNAGVPIVLDLYGTIAGRVGDPSTGSLSDPNSTTPVRWGSVRAVDHNDSSVVAPEQLNADGTFLLWLPVGEQCLILAFGTSYWGVNTTATAPSVGDPPAWSSLLSTHFGWARGQVLSTGSVLPTSIGIFASVGDPTNLTSVVGTSTTDEFGLFNVSAPFGPSVLVSANLLGLGSFSENATIAPDQTTQVPALVLNASNSGTEYADSLEVSTYEQPVIATIVDSVTRLAVPGTRVLLDGNDGSGPQGVLLSGNDLGQFMVGVPTSPTPVLSVEELGYISNFTALPTPTAPNTLFSTVNLTAFGIVQGSVVTTPGDVPVFGATITACPQTGPVICTSVASNASGGFWLGLAPGPYVLNVNGFGYLYNSSIGVTIASNQFTALPPITLYPAAVVQGAIISSETGNPIEGASVSFCPE